MGLASLIGLAVFTVVSLIRRGSGGWAWLFWGAVFFFLAILAAVLTLAIGIGVPSADAFHFGSLVGTKVVLNEFVSYIDLVGLIKGGTMSAKGVTMATYALCGFANFSSIGIQIGGIGALAPNRRHDLARLGLRAMLAGTLANFITATIAGFLL